MKSPADQLREQEQARFTQIVQHALARDPKFVYDMVLAYADEQRKKHGPGTHTPDMLVKLRSPQHMNLYTVEYAVVDSTLAKDVQFMGERPIVADSTTSAQEKMKLELIAHGLKVETVVITNVTFQGKVLV